MLEEAIRYPWKGEDNVETIAIGGILSLLGFLIVPVFPVYGYAVRVIRDVSAGADEYPPVFEDWEELFVDGLKAVVVALVYSLVPLAMFAVAAVAWFVPVTASAAADGPGALGAVGFLVGVAVTFAAVAASLALVYLVPAAVAAFARTGRLGAAFSASDLRAIGGSKPYATGWLVAVAVTLLASVAASALSMTGVGALLVPFVSFYGTVAAAYAIGEGIAEIPLIEREETAAVGESTA